MKNFKGFDFFQKISIDNVTQPTIVGSLLSLSAIGLMVFLLVREIIDYFTPSILKNTIVYHDTNQQAKIITNLGIKFPGVPCALLSVDQEDSVGNHRMDIHDTLTKFYLKQDGSIHEGNPRHTTRAKPEDLVKAINQQDGCLISGQVPISKVPGDIHISFHNYADLYQYIKHNRNDLLEKISMNHQLTLIHFGDVNKDVLQRFGYDAKTFDLDKDIPSFLNEKKKMNYDYFIKLIPHIFEDESSGESYMGYQYSMTAKTRIHNQESNEMPIVMIKYDLSPVTMKITLEAKSIARALTHICAIVGGIYVIFSLLNRVTLTIFEFTGSSQVATK